MPNFKFVPDPSGKSYKVDIQIYQQGDRRENTCLSYVSTIQLRQQRYDGYFVSVRRENNVLDRAWTYDHPSDELVLLKSEVFKNVHLFISKEGVVQRVRNQKNIWKNWKVIRSQTESSYKGEMLTELLDSIENRLTDADKLLGLFLEDPFIPLFLRLFNNRAVFLENESYMADFPLPGKTGFNIYKYFRPRMMERSGLYKYQLILTIDYSDREDIYRKFCEMKQEKVPFYVDLTSYYLFADKKTLASCHGLYEAGWKDELWKKTKIDILVL